MMHLFFVLSWAVCNYDAHQQTACVWQPPPKVSIFYDRKSCEQAGDTLKDGLGSADDAVYSCGASWRWIAPVETETVGDEYGNQIGPWRCDKNGCVIPVPPTPQIHCDVDARGIGHCTAN